MKKGIITYLLIIAIMTGCSVQSQPDKNGIFLTSTGILQSSKSSKITKSNNDNKYDNGKYKKIEVDGGDINGNRRPSVVVDIGYGKREYWAYTNEFGQLVRVTAKKIILQDDKSEPVLENGRYYLDEARVPGTEKVDYDQGHVIADSLGGVSNAYNITPQVDVLNRHGDQAYMERSIREAGGCTDFEAIITYPNTKTQIPNHYRYTYTLKGNVITDDFDNVNPDKANKSLNEKSSAKPETTSTKPSTTDKNRHNIDTIDKNHDGKVTIAEAKNAGYKMPITKDHWLFRYMEDKDGDGMVGE